MDNDLQQIAREQLTEQVRELRDGIRKQSLEDEMTAGRLVPGK